MSLLDTIIQAHGGGAVQQIGAQLGLAPEQTTSALSALVPALAAGVQQQAQNPNGLSALLSALSSGQHQQYVDNPSTLAAPQTTEDGNAILGHIFGSKDVSRQVATQAAAHTGLGEDVLKRMMPMAAALVMGALARHVGGAAATGTSTMPGLGSAFTPGAGSSLMNVLNATLQHGEGSSLAGSVTSMLGKFLQR
jgi:hypothetical protein